MTQPSLARSPTARTRTVVQQGGAKAKVRDLTVLRQIAHHLDGWSGLNAQIVTEGVAWPGVQVQAGGGAQTWQCEHDRWTGQVLHAAGVPIATIQTTIGEDASAGEVADGIKAIYRLLRTAPETG
jgi:hypothetical protein